MLDLVDENALDWRPETGDNWMTTGQLLTHLTTACGFCCRAFVTGDWGPPPSTEGADGVEAPTDEELPAAGAMAGAASVAEVRELLESDRKVTLAMILEAGEEDLASKLVAAPWNPSAVPLGRQFLMSIAHLSSHKGQLFYYLKLQGKQVDTGTLWGI